MSSIDAAFKSCLEVTRLNLQEALKEIEAALADFETHGRNAAAGGAVHAGPTLDRAKATFDAAMALHLIK